jgi:hypothetical protein
MPEVAKRCLLGLAKLEGDRVSAPEVNASLAVILLRYEAADIRQFGTGERISSCPFPVTSAFYMAVRREVECTGEYIAPVLAKWICENRNKLGKSRDLDRAIADYKAAIQQSARAHRR